MTLFCPGVDICCQNDEVSPDVYTCAREGVGPAPTSALRLTVVGACWTSARLVSQDCQNVPSFLIDTKY